MERAARELSTLSGGYIILVESATHQRLMGTTNRFRDAPGDGEFTFDADRVGIGRMVTQMVWSKLLHYLDHGDFHNYRFLLNSHSSVYCRGLDVEPIDGVVPGFRTDPSVDSHGLILDRFLHQNGLRTAEAQKQGVPRLNYFRTSPKPLSAPPVRTIFERDAGGWPPICFAAMSNNLVVLQVLLDRRVDVNQVTTKAKPEASFPPKMTALGVASFFRNNEAVELLLCARAHVNYKDAWGSGALHPACAGDNPLGVRLLCHALLYMWKRARNEGDAHSESSFELATLPAHRTHVRWRRFC